MKKTKRLNICIFLPSLRAGGAERVMVTLANGLSESGLDVCIVLAEKTGPMAAMLAPSVELHELRFSGYATAIPSLAFFIRRKKPDVLISALYVANLAALIASKLSGMSVPIIGTEHSSILKTLEGRSRVRRRLLIFLIKNLYPKLQTVVTVTPEIAEELNQLSPVLVTKTTTIPNPIDNDAVRRLAKMPVQAEDGSPLILAVGRLERVKRYDTLIQAYHRISTATQAKLVILGEGPERKRLERLCKQLDLENKVALPGYVENPFSFMARAAMLVLSSEREGLPTVLLEAMALGTQIVATDCPHGPRFILDDGRLGRLVPVGNIDALASAIEETLNTPLVSGTDLIERSKAFDKAHAIESYVNLIEEACSQERQSR